LFNRKSHPQRDLSPLNALPRKEVNIGKENFVKKNYLKR
jgi:hypothetical protein